MYAFGQQNRAIAEILLKNKASPKKGIDQALKQSRNLKMLEFLESLNLEYGKNDIAKALSDLRKEGKTESVPVGAQ